jgi:hypothetical protein
MWPKSDWGDTHIINMKRYGFIARTLHVRYRLLGLSHIDYIEVQTEIKVGE